MGGPSFAPSFAQLDGWPKFRPSFARAALSSAFVAQEIQADVLDITWDGGLESVAINFAETDGYSPPHLLGIDQLGPGVDLRVRNTLISYTFPLTYYGMGSGFFRYTYRNVRNTGQAVTAIFGRCGTR